MVKKPEFIPTRESLLSRLKNWNDNDGWSEFFKIYRQLIFATAVKAGLREDEAEEVVQETVLSVAKTIKDFKYDPKKCRFKNWLGHLAQKRIADRFRKRAREARMTEGPSSRTSNRTAAIERVPNPTENNLAALWEEEWQQKIVASAITQVKSAVSAEQFQIFDFYVVKKKSAREVARDLGVNLGQVYLAGHRVSRLLKKTVQRLKVDLG